MVTNLEFTATYIWHSANDLTIIFLTAVVKGHEPLALTMNFMLISCQQRLKLGHLMNSDMTKPTPHNFNCDFKY